MLQNISPIRSTAAVRIAASGARLSIVAAALLTGCAASSELPATPRAEETGASRALGTTQTPRGAASQPPAVPVARTANREAESGTQALAYPTGNRATSVLLLEKVFPMQARLGQPYKYDLKVTNLTDYTLTSVVVRERLPDSFRAGNAPATAPTTVPAPAPAAAAAVIVPPVAPPPPATLPADLVALQPATRPGDISVAAGATTVAAAPPPVVAPPPPVTSATEAPPAPPVPDSADGQAYAIGDLAPRATKTVSVSGVAGRLGKLDTLTSVSYTPLLAGGTEVINPILRLSKTAPADADLCQPIAVKYTVSNVGVGTETQVRIDETLPEGLTTVEGKRTIAIDVGDLPESTAREFTVKLKAARVGKYAGVAAAKGTGTNAQSADVATQVRAPKLAVTLAGPESEYVGKAATYDLVVSNTGDAPARDTLVDAAADNGAELIWFAGIKPDAPAGTESSSSSNQSLGTIEPGQSRKARVAIKPTRGGPMTVTLRAKATCADPTSATARTSVLTIPALLLEVTDRDDLIRIGEDAVYTIRVKNQGSGADKNVRIVVTLPAQLSLVKTGGATEAKVEGQQISFAPLASLAPGDSATWTVDAKALKAGDVRFKVELTSESLTEPAMETEPTKLY